MANKDDLKNAIKTASDLNDEYIVSVDKYINIDQLTPVLDFDEYKITKRPDKENVFDVFLIKNKKVIQNRKAVIRNNVLFVCRKPSKKIFSFYKFYLVFSLFGR